MKQNDDSARRQEQAELLDSYWESLTVDLEAPKPTDLDPELALLAQDLAAGSLAPHQEPDSTERVRRRLEAQAQLTAGNAPTPSLKRSAGKAEPGATWWQRMLFRWPAGLAGTAALALVVLGIYLVAFRPQPANAQAILERAQEAATSPSSGGINSLVLTEVWRSWLDAGPAGATHPGDSATTQGEAKRWFEAPDRWRVEAQVQNLSSDGKVLNQTSSVTVSDGKDLWQFDAERRQATVSLVSPSAEPKGGALGFGQSSGDLNALLEQVSTCFAPRITGSALIAGRDTYIIDLGPNRCPSASVGQANGRQVMWVDKQSALVLKHEVYGTEDGRLLATSEVKAIEINGPVDPARFTFTPPEGAKVTDSRPEALTTLPLTATPKPDQTAVVPGATSTPNVDPLQVALLDALSPLARQADYPLFAPASVPSGLVPRQPRLNPADTGTMLHLEYVPPEAVEKDADAMQSGLVIDEQRATYEIVTNWTSGATPVAMPAGKGWVRRGTINADGTGTNSAALALRDGTLVTASSFSISPEELLRIVRSLQLVPRSHAAQPEPAVPGLEELRQEASFPIFVPTWVPAGLTPAPPVGYQVTYHDQAGRSALTVLNGEAGCCLAADPRKAGTEVRLANGSTAHLLGGGPDGSLLWWEQEGSYIALSGPNLGRADLVKIAESMSRTASLGQVEPIGAATPASEVPTPTPLPTPAFQVLRPAWLPEPMATREQVDGQRVILGFVPQATQNDGPHLAMTLQEMPQSASGAGGAPDLQAAVEQIGAYQVTIIYRGEACISLEWNAGDLHLTLTNVYDPPGKAKYSCEQMRRIVESIR